MANEIFFTSTNALSDRTAILEDDERVAYLYLTAAGTQQIARDVILYMRVEPVGRSEWEAARNARSAPVLTRDIPSGAAVIANPEPSGFAFVWNGDGSAVAVLYHGVPIAFTSMAERFGYTKAVSTSSPLACAWDEARYASLFEE